MGRCAAALAVFLTVHMPSLQGQLPTGASPTVLPAKDHTFYGLTPQLAVSPDGRRAVYVAAEGFSAPTLWVQSIPDAGVAPMEVGGTEQASYPFWSADGAFIAFFAGGKLKKVRQDGGSVDVVCDAPNGRGGTWNKNGVILFTSGITDPLRKVSASGGAVTMATRLDSPREGSHRWPQFLPDGQHFVYWAGAGTNPAMLKIGTLDSNDAVPIVQADSNGTYGLQRVFFSRSNVLMSQALDPASFKPIGDATRVDEPLSGDAGSSYWSLAASGLTGTLLYVKGNPRGFVLSWFDRSGKKVASGGTGEQLTNVALQRGNPMCTAVSLTGGTPPNRDIWIRGLGMTFERGKTGFIDSDCAQQRLTTDPGVDATPLWSPDSRQVVYSSQRGAPYQMYLKGLAAASSEERLLTSPIATIATDWCRNGKHVIFTRGTAATGMDVWALPMTGDRTPFAITSGPGAKDNGNCSPDGQWIAYQSNESGRDEIYITSLSDRTKRAVRVSSAGGAQPLWRSDGRELFFLAPDGAVMASTVAPQNAIQIRAPQKLFAAPVSLVIRRSYDVTEDGQHFLIPVIDDSIPQRITISRAN
jgi:Tol biopolymer transport system component